MSADKKEKRWSAGTLKSRGWTEALLSQLLPAPQYRHYNGRRVRCWRSEDVRRAEATLAFRQARESGGEEACREDVLSGEAALEQTSLLLTRAWNAAALPEGRAGLLAERYHQAILHQLPGLSLIHI